MQRRQRSKCTLSTAAAGVAGGKERAQRVGLASSARLSLARRRQHQLANPAPAAASSLCEPGWFVIKRGCAGAHARGGTGTHHLAILHLHHRVQERWVVMQSVKRRSAPCPDSSRGVESGASATQIVVIDSVVQRTARTAFHSAAVAHRPFWPPFTTTSGRRGAAPGPRRRRLKPNSVAAAERRSWNPMLTRMPATNDGAPTFAHRRGARYCCGRDEMLLCFADQLC